MAEPKHLDYQRRVEQAATAWSHLEVWANQFRYRGHEFQVFAQEAQVTRHGRVLEVGCGNGLITALLAERSERVVSTDLPNPGPETASQGMRAARDLLRGLDVTNAQLTACRGEALPFADNSFDAVFSAYTLEHIPDPAAAVREMARVLRPKGKLWLILPTTVERLTFFPAFYQIFWNRFWSRITHRQERTVVASACLESQPRATAELAPTLWRRFRRSYPHFPWPEPHGAYAHYIIELVMYHPWRWKRLVTHSGFVVQHHFSSILFPYYLVGMLTDPFPWLQRWSRMVRPIQAWPGFRTLGHNYCIVASLR